MKIPRLSSIKNYALIALSFSLVVFWALLNSEKKSRAQENLKLVKKAREIERKAATANMEGVKDEKKVLDSIDINDDDKLI